jgi:hypothetical protein
MPTDKIRQIKRDWMRRWRKENPEAAKAAIEKAKGKYRESHRRANMAWRSRNPKKHRAYNLALERKWRNGLETPYVKYQMSRGTSVPSNHWPIDLVEAKRAQLKLKRLCRELRTTHN